MKDSSFIICVVTCLIGFVIFMAWVFSSCGYMDADPLVINITNASAVDMPIEIYLNGELVDTRIVPSQGQSTYEHPKPAYELFHVPNLEYTISIRAPNTIYEREGQSGETFFVLD